MKADSKIAIFALGGTIASSNSGQPGVEINVSGLDLVADLARYFDVGKTEVHQVRNVASGDITWADIFDLRDQVEEVITLGSTGVVVTQGTNTLEETSYLFDLLYSGSVPVIFTGAMRNTSSSGADGPANLLASIQVASSSAARNLGVLVVINDQIHAARHVRKTHTTSVATFLSATAGPLGYVHEGAVRIHSRPVGRYNLSIPTGTVLARVAAIPSLFDGDKVLIESVPNLGYQGLVIMGFGGGQISSWLVDSVATVAQQIPVVLSSRTGSGEMLRQTYGYAGSEIDLLQCGIVSGGWLNWTHTVVLLRLLLSVGTKTGDLQDSFDRACNLDIFTD